MRTYSILGMSNRLIETTLQKPVDVVLAFTLTFMDLVAEDSYVRQCYDSYWARP